MVFRRSGLLAAGERSMGQPAPLAPKFSCSGLNRLSSAAQHSTAQCRSNRKGRGTGQKRLPGVPETLGKETAHQLGTEVTLGTACSERVCETSRCSIPFPSTFHIYIPFTQLMVLFKVS